MKDLLVIVHNVDCHWSRREEDDRLDQGFNLQKQHFFLQTKPVTEIGNQFSRKYSHDSTPAPFPNREQ